MRGASPRLAVGLLVLVSLAPVAMLVLRALAPTWRFPELLPAMITGAGDGATFTSLLGTSSRLREALVNSVLLAVVAGAIATVGGFAAGRALVRASGWVRRAATMAAFLPVIAPPIALGVGVQVLTLAAGVGGTWAGVLLSHLVPATGYATLYFLGVLSAVEHSMEEEARTLGATRWQALWRVTLPALRGRLADAFVLAALVSWGQLALTLLVGGGAVRTLPVELLSYVRAGDDRVGAIAALLLTVPPLLALGLLQAGATRTGAST